MGSINIICVFSLIVASMSGLPIKSKLDQVPSDDIIKTIDAAKKALENETKDKNRNQIMTFNNVRPGMDVTRYEVEITPNIDDRTFSGRLRVDVNVVDSGTLENDILFHIRNLNIDSVNFSFAGGNTFREATFRINDGRLLEIRTGFKATLYTFIIEYNGHLDLGGQGLYVGQFGNNDYIAMNLHPVNARRVFPCVDEPNDLSTVVFNFKELGYNNIVSNSQLEENSATQFKPLQGPVHTWGMVAHNLININLPVANVLLYARPGITNQDAQASAAINFLFTNLNTWTEKQYFEIILNQNEQMHIFALPDNNRDWYALSTVCIWEPYILMERDHSVKQRATALSNIAEAMSRQWFGYAIYPENFRFQWVITGLAKYAAYDLLKTFQTDEAGEDVTLIDMDVIFTTEIIQESLLRDSYSTSQPLQPASNIFEENHIRDTVNGLIKYKAPAIMRMFRLVLGDATQDFIQSAARALFNRNPLLWVNSMNFYDAINSKWLFEGNKIVEEIAGYANPWVENPGYPLVHVGLRQGGLVLTQEYFSFTPAPRRNFLIPITYTTGTTSDYDNIHPTMMLDATTTLTLALVDEDFVIFNLQGQGYYRVNYDLELWTRIINALNDPDQRETIHPLNRGTLIDDSLNMARARKLEYPTAFNLVLSMELETEYPAWKAFVRNMDFIRKHLLVYADAEDLDHNIYVRILQRTITSFEEEIGFKPEPNTIVPAMVSLTRGLVMDHACRANYEPCIAAAIDWFYDPNNNEQVNPNIPHEIRPAVYCTMVKEGDEGVIEVLRERLTIEPTQYERLVILEALTCSTNPDFIQELLLETIAENSTYGVEERCKIFKAVAESNSENTNIALTFISRNTNEIRQKYGGPDKLEELIYLLADNIVGPDQLDQFVIWLNSVNNNLEDSRDLALRVRDQVLEVMAWRETYIQEIYEWFDENDASTTIVSSILIFLSLCVALFNN